MHCLSAQWISKTLNLNWTSPVKSSFTSVSIDSRNINSGALFVAIKGPTRHGQEFLQKAKDAGALAAIVENKQPIDFPQLVVKDSVLALQQLAKVKRKEYTGKVIGLTGSSGKTSTKELLAHLLGPKTYKTKENFNNHLGVPITILEMPMSAPYAVIEAGISNFGEMQLLADIIQPDAALITLIGSAHLEFFKTKEKTAEEKSLLLKTMRKNGFAVIHERELQFKALQNLKYQTLVLCKNGKKLPNLPINFKGQKFDLRNTDKGWMIHVGSDFFNLPPWSQGVAENAGLCLALAKRLKISHLSLARRLQSWKGANMRGEWKHFKGAPKNSRIFLDAYNSNPEALVDSLGRFQRLSGTGRARLYILGTMAELGIESDAMHENAGKSINLGTRDFAWLVGSHAKALANGIIAGGGKKEQLAYGDDLNTIQAKIKKFEGDCFVKGSHSTGLYKLADMCEIL